MEEKLNFHLELRTYTYLSLFAELGSKIPLRKFKIRELLTALTRTLI
jgi:hypothetical protein